MLLFLPLVQVGAGAAFCTIFSLLTIGAGVTRLLLLFSPLIIGAGATLLLLISKFV